MLETDLYAITMSYSYWSQQQHENVATFEGFVRKLPADRNFLVFAGLAPLLATLQNWKITKEEVDYLKSLQVFKNAKEQFWSWLEELRFTCDVWAPKEGTLLFANEPFIRVTGPLAQAQLVETLILNTLNYSTAVASKAARMRLATRSAAIKLSEFGFRRAAGPDAAFLASRAAYIGGFNSTSNVQAGYKEGLPVTGTMAHSYVMAHASEVEAFQKYKESYPEGATVLIDTYDPLKGTQLALEVFGTQLAGVRLDSGDKIALSRAIRVILDKAGNRHTDIIVSDDMNEHKIKTYSLLEAPINGYGVGTELVSPGPLGGVYKLVEYKGLPRVKLSEAKSTYPRPKQIFREYDEQDVWIRDVIGKAEEKLKGVRLLQKVLQSGTICEYTDMNETKALMFRSLRSLPLKFLSLDNVFSPNVTFSTELEKEMTELRKQSNDQ